MEVKTALVASTALTLLLLVPVAFTRYQESSEIRLRDYLFNHPNYSSKARPVLDYTSVVNVTLEVFLYAMIQFNERDEMITTASWMQVYWEDERLSWDPADFDWIHVLVLRVEDIWSPSICLFNSLDTDALNLVSSDRGTVILASNGGVYLGAPFIVSTQCALQIQYFPFDTQMCELIFSPENQGPTLLDINIENSTTRSDITSLEWNLLGTTVTNSKSPYVEAKFCIFLQRDPKYYISTIIVPSTVMCLLSLATFLAPPDSGERISLGVSMVLGLTVFQLLIADTLPTSSKQSPILSNYLAINFIIACLAVPFSLVNINIAYRDKKLTFLKYRWIRIMFMEYLSCCMGVPTRSEPRENDVSKITETSITRDDKSITTAKVHPGVIRYKNAWPPDMAFVPDDHSAKVKQENRIVALIMDRLFLAGFLILVVIVIIKLVFDFNTSPGVDFHNGCSP